MGILRLSEAKTIRRTEEKKDGGRKREDGGKEVEKDRSRQAILFSSFITSVLRPQSSVLRRVSIHATSEEIKSKLLRRSWAPLRGVSIHATSEEIKSVKETKDPNRAFDVSIHATSEEIKSRKKDGGHDLTLQFPFMRLPKKSKV
jgi:hypothetical protein